MANPKIFDQKAIENFRKRAFLRHGKSADFLLKFVAEDLSDRLKAVDRKFNLALDVHGHSGEGIRILKQSLKVENIEQIETDEIYANNDYPFYKRGREFLDLKINHYNLIISLLSLHMVNDVVGNLIQIKNALKPDGLFLSVLPGAGTLGELRHCLLEAENELYQGVSARIYPFVDIKDAGALLQRVGFAMPVSDVENITVRYDNVFDLMRDLRAMGMQNALVERSKQPLSKRFFMRVAEIYKEKFSDADGRIRASFSFIWLSGWAPDESQQKPMKPGSAKVSLADILKVSKD